MTDVLSLPLVVLISGTGTTLRNLLARIAEGRLAADVKLVISSTAAAKGLEFARQANIPVHVVPWRGVAHEAEFGREIFDRCRELGSPLVVMAGFLKHVPIPADFENRVVNIHPALVPAFCGQGMYGRRVHEAVLAYGVKQSGCTVHFVDNQYDHGPIILQRVVPVLDDDTPDRLAERVFAAECEAYPDAISLIAAGRVTVEGRRVQIAPR